MRRSVSSEWFALGDEAGARVLVGLSMETGPDTALRVIRKAVLPEPETPRILGVDDFALHRGRKYGTILIDLERRCRVDVLPDRTAETLATWLEVHPDGDPTTGTSMPRAVGVAHRMPTRLLAASTC